MIKIKRGKSTDVYFDTKYQFFEWFNRNTGKYIRTGVCNNEWEDTGVDPFARSFPNLLDVGVMGGCQHGKSGLCIKAGVQCYQNGLAVSEPDMTLEDYKSIVEQGNGKIQQIALGGRGDPNKHKEFEEILKTTVDNGIIPNYTTSGLQLTQNEVELTKWYCGAVAVSWYRSQYTLDAINMFVAEGCTTNVHYVLEKNSIDEAIERLKNDDFTNGVNAVIFLLHKPVGLGQQENVLTIDDARLKEFFGIVDSWNVSFQIGFDSCSIPGIMNFSSNIDLASVDTCEGGRFSGYITPDMIMTPCSFDQDLKYGVSLRDYTIQEAWNSVTFNRFRNMLDSSCKNCSLRYNCYGGCPLKQEIVLCNRGERE